MKSDSQLPYRFRIVRPRMSRWAWCGIAGIVLAIAAGFAGFHLTPPQYEAVTWLRIRPTHFALGDNAVAQNFAATQRQFVRSPLVLQAVLSDAAIAALPIFPADADKVHWLQQRVEAQRVGNSDLFMVSFRCPDRQAAALVANAVRERYLDVVTADASSENQGIVRKLEESLRGRRAEIEDYRRRLGALARSFKSPRGPVTDTDDAIAYAALNEKLSRAEVDWTVKQARASALANGSPQHGGDAAQQDLAAAKAARDRLQVERNGLLVRFRQAREACDDDQDKVAFERDMIQEDLHAKMAAYRGMKEELERIRSAPTSPISARTISAAVTPMHRANPASRWFAAGTSAGLALLAPFLVMGLVGGIASIAWRAVPPRAPRIVVKCGRQTTAAEMAEALEQAAMELRSS